MKRALMFLLLGPALVVVPWLIFIAAIDGLRGPVDFVATVLFIFTFLVAAITGLVDGCLARDLPIRLRTLVTASVGAMIAWILAYAFFTGIFSPSTSLSWLLMSFAIGGAIVMGACSLLSQDYRRPARAFDRAGQPGRKRLARPGGLAPFAVMNHLTLPLNPSFTLAQPEDVPVISP